MKIWIGHTATEDLSSFYYEIASSHNDLHLLTYFHEWNKYYMTYKI